MLKEIERAAALEACAEGKPVLALKGGAALPLDELLTGVRFLVDEDEAAVEKKPERTVRKDRHHASDKEQEILKAWNGGTRTIKEIMEKTGCSYATVRKYIPISPNG